MARKIDHIASAQENLEWIESSVKGMEGRAVPDHEHAGMHRAWNLSAQTAQAQATLALAEHLRIRNLIELSSPSRPDDRVRNDALRALVFYTDTAPFEFHPEFHPEIAQALGIKSGAQQ